jgi:hypothetical protein
MVSLSRFLSGGYFPAAFSKWPPKAKRIADNNLS